MSPARPVLSAPAPKSKSRIAQRNEAKILDAAQEVFASFGVHGATMDRIAQRCGMSKPNLHYYFNTKAELYVAVLRRTLAIWESSLAKLDPEGDPAVELGNYISEKVEMARLHPSASRVFAMEILSGAATMQDYLRTELKELVEIKAVAIRRWIAAGKLAEIDPLHLIFLIWAATQHYADFRPQVLAVSGTKNLTRASFTGIEASLRQIILHGVLAPRGD